MAEAGAREPKMEIRCIGIATSPESPTFLYRQNTGEGDTGCLALAAWPPFPIIIRKSGNRTRGTDNMGKCIRSE